MRSPSSAIRSATPSRQAAARETWRALSKLVHRHKHPLDESLTDLFLARSMRRSQRFVQKGLQTLEQLRLIRRQRSHGRRIITRIVPLAPDRGRP